MTRDEAIRRAVEYVESNALDVGPVRAARFISCDGLDAMAKDCPAELLETHRSVRRQLRDHWVVEFGRDDPPGQTTTPGTQMVCVYASGEIEMPWML